MHLLYKLARRVGLTLFCLLFNGIGSAQSFTQPNAPPLSDSVFSKVGFSAFIEKQLHLLNIPDKNRLLSDLKAFKTPKKPALPPIHGSVAIESFWNTGDTLLYGNAANQAFSSVAPELNFSVAGMPVIGGANLVFQNNSFRPDLSTYTFQFDYARFLDNKRAQLQEQDLAKKRSIWSKSDVTNFTNQTKWETLQNIVYHPDFQQNKYNLIKMCDSLKQSNPLSTEKLRNKIGNLEDEISQYNTAEKELSNLLEHYKKNPDAFAKGDILRGEVDQLKTQLEGELYGQKAQGEAAWNSRKHQLEQKEAVLKNGVQDSLTGLVDARKNQVADFANDAKTKGQQKGQKLLAALQAVEIGSVLLSNSELTVRAMLLNGIRLQTQHGKVYNEIAFGKQNTATRDYSVGFQTIQGARDMNRQVMYYRGGIGERDSNFIHISFARILDNGKDSLSASLRPHYNDLVSVSAQERFGKSIVLTSELAYSLYKNDASINRFEIPQNDNASQKNATNYSAFQLKIAQTDADSWQWSLVYDYIGAKFTTLGNPYLLNNRQILRGSLAKSFWSEKVKIKLAYDKNISLPNATDWQPAVDQTGFSAELGLRYGRGNRFTVRLAPRYFLLSAVGGTEGVGRSDVYTIQNVLQGKIGQYRWLSVIHFTNLNMLTPLQDSGRLSGLNYVFIQKNLMYKDKWTLSAISNLGFERNFSSFREASVQINSNWQFKHGLLGGGLQSFRTIDGNLQAGGLLTGNWQTKKLGTFGLQFSYRKSIKQDFSKQPILSGQTFYRFSF